METHTQKKMGSGKVKAFQLEVHTHMKRLMMGVYDQAHELLFLGAVKVFTRQQNLIDRRKPPLYKGEGNRYRFYFLSLWKHTHCDNLSSRLLSMCLSLCDSFCHCQRVSSLYLPAILPAILPASPPCMCVRFHPSP